MIQNAAHSSLDPESLRGDFPILARETRPGVPLIYLDSAATAQKPEVVIRAMDDYYRISNANIHRGLHTLAEEATALYEEARQRIAQFIGAKNARQLIFTRNTTESINLVAQTWGKANLKAGDLVISTEMEHHSNLVPWQMLTAENGLRLEFIPFTDEGLLDLEIYHQLLRQSPRLVVFTHMSNVLGTINPAKEMIILAHQAGAMVVLDGAQSVPHFSVSVSELDADFMAFSAHKMCGPTGIGVLYGREELLQAMPPYMGGGDMIRKVRLRSFTTNELPYKFEAGTPAIAEAIGFGAAVAYLSQVGMEEIAAYEHQLTKYALERMAELRGVRVLGPSAEYKGGVISFVMDNIHPHDVAEILNDLGIAVRAGHHCAMPLHEKFQIPASTRASLYLYNTKQEVDALLAGVKKVQEVFR
jgi:cysteine desulfurase/selenocysteine lyase